MKGPFFYSGVNTYLPLVKFDLTPKLFFLYIWHLCTERASQGRQAGENLFIYFLCQSDLNYFFLLCWWIAIWRGKKSSALIIPLGSFILFSISENVWKRKKMCETKWRKETEEINFCDGTKWKRFEEYFFFLLCNAHFSKTFKTSKTNHSLSHIYFFLPDKTVFTDGKIRNFFSTSSQFINTATLGATVCLSHVCAFILKETHISNPLGEGWGASEHCGLL